MIGKQTKGTSFSGCVRYVLKEEKSKLLEAVGVNGSPEQMAEQFELQALLNDKVKNIVGHTSLNFSPEDGECLKSDDALMLQIAHDYMKLMGIENTQYIIARHIDREHPHCHIVFNRVDNDGKTISDKNDFRRNEKVCKMLTAKYRLHFANGKDHIKEERLRPFIIVRSNFKKNQEESLKDLARFFKEYMPRYGYKYLCTEDDDHKYYQTLGLKCIMDGFCPNYALALKDLNI